MSADKLTPEEVKGEFQSLYKGASFEQKRTILKVFSHIRSIEAELAAKDAALAEAREVIGPFARIAPGVEITPHRDGNVVHRQTMPDGKYLELSKNDFKIAATWMEKHK